MSPATEPLLGPKRQRELLNYIRAYGTGSVTEMAKILGVSASTVRRDLNELQERGLVERIHGGAAPLTDDVEPLRPLREVAFSDEKRRIGQAAASHIADHSTVLILGGTTTEAMLPFLGAVRGLTVLTNSLMVVNRLAQYSDIALIVLGGLLRRQEMSLLGHLTIAGLDEFGIDQVFSGAFGIDPEIGVTGTNLSETQTDRSLASSARELIMLADHSKLTQRGPARLVPTTAVSTLITDDGADADVLQRFREAGVIVETC
ncbi:MAG: DeoR/GlpR transcriptional regulator [Microbacterium sp.]|uniref:DeoR/GlpR family DNA-binding transcription regulator n=2 Tax=Bacteria TaxID=2 RepID=UPI0009F975E6|nr:DeoR/GlpR family DNA-binding transcription regulator [Microbacterium sp.]MBQ9917590.1 DeoR/GlpR transcriptional regulator [Microbacterium sp.]MXS75179.1 DeoR/GlpR transcriptional regulator [Microbacterium sp. TL13]